MDGQTDVHHLSRCPARAASLGHARARLLVVSPVICLARPAGSGRSNSSTGGSQGRRDGIRTRNPTTGFSTSGLACPVRIRHLFRWFSRATLGAMPLWLLTYTFTCSQAECGYHNALDAVVQADTPKTAASQVGKSQHLCGRCGRPLTDYSSLKMAVPVLMSSVEKKRPVSELSKQPSQNCSSR